jgi:DNA-binding NtrC family response regulator
MFNAPPTSDSPHRATAGGQDAAHAGGSNQIDSSPFVCLNAALQRLLVQAEITVPRLQFATLEGAPGTGKHLFAHNMHRRSELHALPFLRRDAREWLASDADAAALIGTLYLDRVDLLEPIGQSLLLNLIKVLQNESGKPTRFLLLLSTQTSLRQLASQGRFLPDLAFRLAAVRFFIPPLRERREDIAPIAQALIDRICRRYQQPTAALAPGTLAHLLQHSWLGNVRELASVLESAILDSTTGLIRPGDLALHLRQESAPFQASQSSGQSGSLSSAAGVSQTLDSSRSSIQNLRLHSNPIAGSLANQDLTLDTAIRRHIQLVLDMFHGNKLQAAKQLAISRSTLYRLLAGSPTGLPLVSTFDSASDAVRDTS